jgi:hypothetical protein
MIPITLTWKCNLSIIYKRIGFFAVQNRCVCPSVRPVSYWLEELRVMGITPRQGYPSVSFLLSIKKWAPAIRTGLKPKLSIGEASRMFALLNKVCQNLGPKPIWLAHCCPNKKKLWFLKIGGSVLICGVPPLGPTYIGESAKAYGLKVRCLHGEHVGEHVVNLGNIFGTH